MEEEKTVHSDGDDIRKQYEKYVKSVPILKPDREAELGAIIRGSEVEVKDLAILELVNGNLRLVLSITKKYRNMPDYVDTLFDGNVGLIESAYRFDPEKGRFSTIAVPAIARSVKDGIMSRIGSTVTVTKNAAGHAYKIKNLDLGETSELKDNELALAKLASFALMDAISIYDENGDPINDLVDPVSMMDEIQMNDLVELVSKAAETLGLSEDDLILVSEASQKRSEHGTVRRIADKKGVSTQAVRMYRLKIIWQIRKEVLRHVGKTEYLMLSGKLPVINWREVCKK